MLRFLQRLFLFERFKIKTTLTKEQIESRIIYFLESERGMYRGRITRKGFKVAQKSVRYHRHGSSRNSFAPVAKAKIKKVNGFSTISGVLRMHGMVSLLFAPIYFVLMIVAVGGLISSSIEFAVPFLVVLIVMYFVFLRPAKRLREHLEDLLIE